MRIFVTGGAGFIGKYLIRKLLVQNHEIVIFDNFSNSSKNELKSEFQNITIIEGDIRNLEKISEHLENIDIVIHLAAKISVTDSIKNPKEVFEVNVEGTENILKACLKHNVKKFIALSSAAVYGNNFEFGKNFSEHDNTNPISPYGESKLDMEKAIEKICQKYDIKGIVLRLFNVYGKGQTDEYAGVITKFVESIKKNNSLIIYGDGNQTRDFISIEDVIEIIDKIITSKFEKKFEIFNFANGKVTKIIDLANLILTISGKKLKINFKEKRKGEILHSTASIAKIKKKFEYSPKIDLKQGVEKFLSF